MTTRFEAPAAVLGPVRWAWLCAPALLSLFAAYLTAFANPLGFLLQILAFAVAGVFVAQRPRPRTPLTVRVDEAGSVHLGASQFALAGDIAGMLVAPNGSRMMIALERFDGSRVDLELDSLEHLAELRASLRAGTELSSQTFRGHVPFGGLSSLLVIAVTVWLTCWVSVAMIGTSPLLASLLAPLILIGMPLAVATLRTWQIRLGTEGVLLRRAFGWRRRAQLLSYRDVTVRPGRVPHHVALYREDQKLLGLELGNAREARNMAASVQHRSTLPAAGGGENLESQLARGDRATGEWVTALLRDAQAGQESYRIPRVPAEQLWAVLENPDAEPSARIGAALTLRVQIGTAQETRQRLAVASRSTALAEVRSATEILAADEPEATAMAKLTRTLP